MFKVSYYMTSGTRSRKYFETLHDAIMFSVFRVPLDNLYEITKERND